MNTYRLLEPLPLWRKGYLPLFRKGWSFGLEESFLNSDTKTRRESRLGLTNLGSLAGGSYEELFEAESTGLLLADLSRVSTHFLRLLKETLLA